MCQCFHTFSILCVLTQFCILQWLHKSHLEGTNGIKSILPLISPTIVHKADAFGELPWFYLLNTKPSYVYIDPLVRLCVHPVASSRIHKHMDTKPKQITNWSPDKQMACVTISLCLCPLVSSMWHLRGHFSFPHGCLSCTTYSVFVLSLASSITLCIFNMVLIHNLAPSSLYY